MTIKFIMNKRVEIYTLDNQKIGDSTIQDEDDQHIYISIPLGSKNQGKLHIGEKISVMYCGEDNKVFMFTTEVVDTVQDQIPLIKLFKPEKYEIIQRRQYVRIPLMIDFEYIPLKENFTLAKGQSVDGIKEIFSNEKWEKGYTYDLSAGGAGVVLHEHLGIKDELLCILQDNDFSIVVKGEVKRVIKNSHAGDRLFKIGIRFKDLDFIVEEKIVGYIFKKMRDQLKVR